MAVNKRGVVEDVVLSRARSLSDSELRRLWFDPLVAKLACTAGLNAIEPYVERLQKEYAGFDVEELRMLPELCDRAFNAQDAVDKIRAREHSVPSVVTECLEWRSRLLPVADALATNGHVDAVELARIREGLGVADYVKDVANLLELMKAHVVFVELAVGKGGFEKARLVFEKALKSLGTSPVDVPELSAAIELRDRYGTLIMIDHERLRLALAVFTSTKNAESVVGSLHGMTGRKAKAEEAPESPPEQGPA